MDTEPFDLEAAKRVCGEATPEDWVLSSEEQVATLRRLFGAERVPEDVVVIDHPPATRQEAMETFMTTVMVGWMERADATFAVYARTALPHAVAVIERLAAASRHAVASLESEADSLQERSLSAGAAFALQVADTLRDALVLVKEPQP